MTSLINMGVYVKLTLFLWMVFAIFWLISSIGVKKTVNRSFGGYGGPDVFIRLLIALIVLVIFREVKIRSIFHLTNGILTGQGGLLGIFGVALCSLGVSFAIWARIYLGKNWGMPMSLKEKPELITKGPYSFVRHPIYTGILIITLGSIFSVSIFWVIPLLIFTLYFFYSAQIEEKNMEKEFPKEYPTYKKKTKMLLPFIF